jgi:membrane protein
VSGRPPTADRRPPKEGAPALLKAVGGWLAAVASTLTSAGRAFRDQHGPLMAAAVSFWGLLSIAPTILLAVSVFGYFIGSSEAAFHQVMRYARTLLSGEVDVFRDALQAIVESRAPVAGSGLILLAWTGTQWVATLESAVNIQWGLPSRGFLASRLLGLLLFLCVALLFLLSTLATTLLTTLTQWRVPGLEFRLERIPFLWQFAAHLLPVVLSVLMFALLYGLLPNTRVVMRAVWIGALVAGGAWEGAKLGYAWYLAHFAPYGAVYGSLGALVGLILWIYYSSVLALFGNELVRLLHHRMAVTTGLGRRARVMREQQSARRKSRRAKGR